MRFLMPAMLLGFLLPVADEAMCAPPDDAPMTGTWVYAGTEGTPGTQECPDFVTFAPDGRYRVENECASTDPGNPVAETGSWSLERSKEGSVLVLANRKLIVDEDFLGKDMSPRIRVLGANADALRLEICGSVTAGRDCRIETYRRWIP